MPGDADVLGTCLAMLHSAAADLVAPLAELYNIQSQWGDFGMAMSSTFSFSYFFPYFCP